ncbi:MAG: rhodanese-like domain-containing protein [Haloarculaceae archaeon]
MRRRTVLGSAALAGLAGCLFDVGSETPTSTPSAARDGLPPASALGDRPPDRAVDTDAFARVDVRGTAVPLVPVDVAHYWFRRRAARFADARSRRQYDRSHVLGAVLSTAPDGVADDPVAQWPAADRVVCYCGCPHHLSSLRAATLLRDGYEDVYVVDEGFWAWHDRGYPMAGTAVGDEPRLRIVAGRTDPALAGETVWAIHEPTGQREAASIAADGGFDLHLRFADVTPASAVTLRTPAATLTAPLRDLTSGVVSL